MALGLKKYLALERPLTWLFNGKTLGMQYSAKAISWVMREAVKTAGIAKDVTVHTLRDSYATPSDRRRAEHCHGQRPAGTFQDRNHHDLPSYI